MATPEKTNMLSPAALPQSWSTLTWRQLCDCWACKMRYGGNGDVAQAAALLSLLCGSSFSETAPADLSVERGGTDAVTVEQRYVVRCRDAAYAMTPRELSQAARQAMPWFRYPYGDPGDPAVKDGKGKVVKEARDPVRGYVNAAFRDALALPEETVVVCGDRLFSGSEWRAMADRPRGAVHFALPAVACNSVTWQQYRSLQAVVPQLFQEDVADADVPGLQAQFLAHCLVPARDDARPADRFAPPQVFAYSTDRAEQAVAFWRQRLSGGMAFAVQCLYNICLQAYQTAVVYYAAAYPLLFSDDGKKDTMRDALQGEVGTVNTVMKYAGYAEQQQVYDSNLPFVLDILNTMAKEAKQIEAMNARIKRK